MSDPIINLTQKKFSEEFSEDYRSFYTEEEVSAYETREESQKRMLFNDEQKHGYRRVNAQEKVYDEDESYPTVEYSKLKDAEMSEKELKNRKKQADKITRLRNKRKNSEEKVMTSFQDYILSSKMLHDSEKTEDLSETLLPDSLINEVLDFIFTPEDFEPYKFAAHIDNISAMMNKMKTVLDYFEVGDREALLNAEKAERLDKVKGMYVLAKECYKNALELYGIGFKENKPVKLDESEIDDNVRGSLDSSMRTLKNYNDKYKEERREKEKLKKDEIKRRGRENRRDGLNKLHDEKSDGEYGEPTEFGQFETSDDKKAVKEILDLLDKPEYKETVRSNAEAIKKLLSKYINNFRVIHNKMEEVRFLEKMMEAEGKKETASTVSGKWEAEYYSRLIERRRNSLLNGKLAYLYDNLSLKKTLEYLITGRGELSRNDVIQVARVDSENKTAKEYSKARYHIARLKEKKQAINEVLLKYIPDIEQRKETMRDIPLLHLVNLMEPGNEAYNYSVLKAFMLKNHLEKAIYLNKTSETQTGAKFNPTMEDQLRMDASSAVRSVVEPFVKKVMEIDCVSYTFMKDDELIEHFQELYDIKTKSAAISDLGQTGTFMDKVNVLEWLLGKPSTFVEGMDDLDEYTEKKKEFEKNQKEYSSRIAVLSGLYDRARGLMLTSGGGQHGLLSEIMTADEWRAFIQQEEIAPNQVSAVSFGNYLIKTGIHATTKFWKDLATKTEQKSN